MLEASYEAKFSDKFKAHLFESALGGQIASFHGNVEGVDPFFVFDQK